MASDQLVMDLSITADDFGYCPERNKAIIEVFNARCITDTSLLVNATYASDAATLGRKNNLPMGLHFNITEGKPLSQHDQVSSLLDSNNLFLAKETMIQSATKGLIDTQQVKTELCAQIERFKHLTGYYPRRVDGHQHVHVFPLIRDTFAETLKEYGIKLTRIPNDPSMSHTSWSSPVLIPFLQTITDFAQACKPIFQQHQIRSTEAFIGSTLMNFNNTSYLTLEHLRDVISMLPKDVGSCELMVHPGYPCKVDDGGCGAGPDDFSRDECRRWEAEFLTSDQLKQFLAAQKISLKSFEKLLEK